MSFEDFSEAKKARIRQLMGVIEDSTVKLKKTQKQQGIIRGSFVPGNPRKRGAVRRKVF